VAVGSDSTFCFRLFHSPPNRTWASVENVELRALGGKFALPGPAMELQCPTLLRSLQPGKLAISCLNTRPDQIGMI
jgi:hypothetical protein